MLPQLQALIASFRTYYGTGLSDVDNRIKYSTDIGMAQNSPSIYFAIYNTGPGFGYHWNTSVIVYARDFTLLQVQSMMGLLLRPPQGINRNVQLQSLQYLPTKPDAYIAFITFDIITEVEYPGTYNPLGDELDPAQRAIITVGTETFQAPIPA